MEQVPNAYGKAVGSKELVEYIEVEGTPSA
jgi:hypothetical protein